MLKDGEWSRLYKAMQHRWASHTWPTAKVTLGMKGTNRKNVFQSKKEGVSFCRRRTLWKGTKLFRCEVKTAELTYINVWLIWTWRRFFRQWPRKFSLNSKANWENQWPLSCGALAVDGCWLLIAGVIWCHGNARYIRTQRSQTQIGIKLRIPHRAVKCGKMWQNVAKCGKMWQMSTLHSSWVQDQRNLVRLETMPNTTPLRHPRNNIVEDRAFNTRAPLRISAIHFLHAGISKLIESRHIKTASSVYHSLPVESRCLSNLLPMIPDDSQLPWHTWKSWPSGEAGCLCWARCGEGRGVCGRPGQHTWLDDWTHRRCWTGMNWEQMTTIWQAYDNHMAIWTMYKHQLFNSIES